MNSKHLKTVTDIHDCPVVSIKFFGDLSFTQKRICVVSCDLEGVVYLSYFTDGIISYQCVKQCFMRKRVGPTFSIAPFLINSNKLAIYEDPELKRAMQQLNPQMQQD